MSIDNMQFLGFSPKNVTRHDREVFFTSDLHLGHSNIIGFCNRPFNDVHQMNKALIKNWNEKVPESGLVFVLGDFFFRTNRKSALGMIQRLNGDKVLVVGNHDHTSTVKEILPHLCGLARVLEIKVDDKDIKGQQEIILSHYSHRVWNKSHRGSWHLWGHSHGTLGPHGRSFDVGVDAHNYTPLSYEDVKKKMAKLQPNLITNKNRPVED